MGIVKAYRRIKPELINGIIGVTDKTIVAKTLNQASEYFDLDKSWEAIHFLITGNKAYFGNHQFSMILMPPNETVNISEEEYDFYWDYFNSTNADDRLRWINIENKTNCNVGYLNDQNVKDLVKSITDFDMNNSLKYTNLEILNENGVYPEIWTNSNESKEYLEFHFNALVKFVKRASAANEFIVVIDE